MFLFLGPERSQRLLGAFFGSPQLFHWHGLDNRRRSRPRLFGLAALPLRVLSQGQSGAVFDFMLPPIPLVGSSRPIPGNLSIGRILGGETVQYREGRLIIAAADQPGGILASVGDLQQLPLAPGLVFRFLPQSLQLAAQGILILFYAGVTRKLSGQPIQDSERALIIAPLDLLGNILAGLGDGLLVALPPFLLLRLNPPSLQFAPRGVPVPPDLGIAGILLRQLIQ